MVKIAQVQKKNWNYLNFNRTNNFLDYPLQTDIQTLSLKP